VKRSVEDLQGTKNQDAQKVSAPDQVDVERSVAEWSSDCLLTLHSPIRFTRADWP
jgi:hypothetical protein